MSFDALARVTDKVLLFLAAAFGLVSLLFAWDLLMAVNAEACGAPGAGSDCYPWGAEGHVAGVWSYESKANYLISGASFILATAIALIAVSPALGAEGSLRTWRRITATALLAIAITTWLL